MNLTDYQIEELVKQGPRQSVEFRSDLPVRENDILNLARTMVSFANTNDGLIVIGADPKEKAIVGVDINNAESIEKDIIKIGQDRCSPPVIPEVAIRKIGRKNIIAVSVNAGKGKPYYAEGHCYIKDSQHVRIATSDEIQSMASGQKLVKKPVGGDNLPVENATYDDLDPAKIEDYIEKRKKKFKSEKDISTNILLENIGILIRSQGTSIPSIAGLLLFGKDPQRFLWSSSVNMAKFKGTDKGGSIIDRKELRATIPEMIDEAQQFVVRHMKLSGMFEGLKRLDLPEYPLVAVREAVANAIVHRDYNFKEACIRIFMFDDRIEIYTPGGLPGPVTVENMEYTQYSRNKIIVEALLLMEGYIEKLGTGVRRIKKAAQESGLREPQFIETGVDFILTLFAPGDKISLVEKWDRVNKVQKIIKPPKKPGEIASEGTGDGPEKEKTEIHERERVKPRKKELAAQEKRWAVFKIAVLAIMVIMAARSSGRYLHRKGSPTVRYQAASELHAAKEYERAISKYREFVKSFPDKEQSANAQYYIGSCFEMLGMERKAVKEYEEVILNYPHSDKAGHAQYWIAAIYQKQGLLDWAIEEFQKLILKYPDSPFLVEAFYALGDCYQRQNNPREAIKIYKTALDFHEGISLGFEHYQMGICFKKLGQYEEAGKMFRAVALNRSAEMKRITEAKKQLEEIDAILAEEERIIAAVELSKKKAGTAQGETKKKEEVAQPAGLEEFAQTAGAEELTQAYEIEEFAQTAGAEELTQAYEIEEFAQTAGTEELTQAYEIEEFAQAIDIEAESEEGSIQEPIADTRTIQQTAKESTKEQKIETYLKVAKNYFDSGQYQLAIDPWMEVLALDIYNTEAKEGIDKARAELEKAQKEQTEKAGQELKLIYGIIGSDDQATAVVNSKILEVGDLIDGKVVVKISSQGVILKDTDGEEEEISLEKQE